MKKLEAVTQEQWNEVCDFNRELVESFLCDSVELSPKTKKAYESNLKIWFIWVKDTLTTSVKSILDHLSIRNFRIGWLTEGVRHQTQIIRELRYHL